MTNQAQTKNAEAVARDAFSLTVVVNGTSTEVETNPNAALQSVIAKALSQTNNTGRPPDDWELKDITGIVLDPQKKPRDYNLADNATLFLTLKAGVGGER
jgi:hypothetical protein